MNKPLKATMVFLCATLLAVLLISGSYICLCEADAETPSGEIMAEPTVPTTIVTVPVLPIPTEPTEPFPTHGETGDIKWVVNDEKQLIISKNNLEENCSTGEWSETYIEYVPVHTLDPNHTAEIPIEKLRILDRPWKKCDYSSVIIEEGVTEIGSCTFYGDNFEKITLPDSLTTIGGAALRANISAEFVFPPNLTNIGDGAFSYSGVNLGNVVLPESVSNVGAGAFKNCSKLESVDLSLCSMKNIKENTFKNCINMKTVIFPKQLESIGTSAFDGCLSLENIELPNGLKTIDSLAFWGCNGIDKVVLPESMNSVEDSSFLNTVAEFTILSKDIDLNNHSIGYTINKLIVPVEIVIKGYTGSTAAEYAAKSDKFTFEPLDDGKGDLNKDGLINKNDVQLLQDYLINKAGSDSITAERADVSEDDLINVFDLMVLKRMILQK